MHMVHALKQSILVRCLWLILRCLWWESNKRFTCSDNSSIDGYSNPSGRSSAPVVSGQTIKCAFTRPILHCVSALHFGTAFLHSFTLFWSLEREIGVHVTNQDTELQNRTCKWTLRLCFAIKMHYKVKILTIEQHLLDSIAGKQLS